MPSATAAPAAQPALPDDLLEGIFLRLDDAAELIRAYASCTSFRRIVSDRRFRSRCRSLHRPPAVGFLDCTRRSWINRISVYFYPAVPPHSSAPAARAVARDADFTYLALPLGLQLLARRRRPRWPHPPLQGHLDGAYSL
ncbi:unnamed protein product [Urochloa humidicola]